MPKFSAFTPFGLLKFSGAPSDGETIYRSIAASLGDQFDLTPGTRQEAQVYAEAMGQACALGVLKRAKNQYDPLKAVEMLPALERDWGVIPGEKDLIVTRQRNVAAAQAYLRGARLESVVDALTTLLGANFIKFRVTPSGEVATDLPTSNFARVDLPAKVVTLVDPVTFTGSTCLVTYAPLPGESTVINRGDVVTVQGENASQAEIITANVASLPGGTVIPPNALWANFTKAHDIGASVTTGNFPRWISTQCHVDIVVSSTVVANPVIRQKIHRLMEKLMRVVCTWSIVTQSAGTIGPFTVGISPMGSTCIGTVAL